MMNPFINLLEDNLLSIIHDYGSKKCYITDLQFLNEYPSFQPTFVFVVFS